MPNQEELLNFQREAIHDSQFDPLRLRRNLWEMTNTGAAQIRCKSCEYAKVCWIQPHNSSLEPPWPEWSRLFQWLGPPPKGTKWTVFWFPALPKRQFPAKGETIGPAHLNGGYCYPCNPHIIVVYRLEEATRVLLHEVLHASCTDPQGAPLEIKEATTETWAELFLVALCSKGNMEQAKKLWRIQSQWIVNQNEKIRREHKVHQPRDYAWRYTVGREMVLNHLHIPLPYPKLVHGTSSRLTHPSLCV